MSKRPAGRRDLWRSLATLLLVALVGGLLRPADPACSSPPALAAGTDGTAIDLGPLLPPLFVPSTVARQAAPPVSDLPAPPLAGSPPADDGQPGADDGAVNLVPAAFAGDAGPANSPESASGAAAAAPEAAASDPAAAAPPTAASAPPFANAPLPLAPPAAPDAQALEDQATLETRRPEVQWSPAGSEDWQAVPTTQTVHAGDRVRTGPDASARLVYFEGTSTDLSPGTGILVQRLSHTDNGNIVGSLFQSVGTTVSRVVQLVDPAAGFQVETPAATAFVRGTMPRVDVASDGTTRVGNLPDGTGGLVNVQGHDPGTTTLTLQPGQETLVTPGQPPRPQAPLGTYAAAITPPPPAAPGGGATTRQQQQQQQRQQQQQMLQQQIAQSQIQIENSQAQLEQFTQQEITLQQQIQQMLSATATPGVSSQPPPGARVTPIPPTQARPCGSVGQTCTAAITALAGSGVSGTGSGLVTGSQAWTVTLTGLRPGTTAAVVFQTTAGFETLPCPPATAGATICQGTTRGTALAGSALQVLVQQTVVAEGAVTGPLTVTATATRVPPLLPTATATATSTASASPTGTVTPTGTVAPLTATASAFPSATATASATPTGTLPPTSIPTPTFTSTPTPTTTSTATATSTSTPTPTATATSTATATATPIPPAFVQNIGTATPATAPNICNGGGNFTCTATYSMTTRSTAAAGDSIIVANAFNVFYSCFAACSFSVTPTCSDSARNPYLVDVFRSNNDPGTATLLTTIVCSAKNINAPLNAGSTITLNISVAITSTNSVFTVFSPAAMSANEFSGLSTTTAPLDQTASGVGTVPANTTGTATTSLSGTTSRPAELLFGAIATSPSTLVSPGTNGPAGTPICTNTGSNTYAALTSAGSAQANVVPEYCIVTAIGQFQASGTLTAGGSPVDWAAALATYRGLP